MVPLCLDVFVEQEQLELLECLVVWFHLCFPVVIFNKLPSIYDILSLFHPPLLFFIHTSPPKLNLKSMLAIVLCVVLRVALRCVALHVACDHGLVD